MTVQDNGESILLEAQRLTHGDRNANYGHPLDDYTRTAALMSALLSHKLSEPITAEEAGACMCAVKLSRHMHRPKRDNMVDLAGYAWVVWACTEERERREAMECKDEGCPHYGRPHYHPGEVLDTGLQQHPAEVVLGAGPLEPEGFPGGYAAAPTEEQPDGTVTFVDPKDLPPNGPRCVEPPVSAVHFAQPLELPCGCIKRCKGHDAAAPAFMVENPNAPSNYAAERAQSTTADAEFPQAPRVPSNCVVPEDRDFDPGD
jgi:Domain of unknown function (DUF6378)